MDRLRCNKVDFVDDCQSCTVLCCSADVATDVDVQDVAVVMFVVVGSDRIGSQRNATDPTRPSVCGWLAPTAPSVTYQDIKIR